LNIILLLKVVISKDGQIDSNHFFDPRSGQSFTFDHMRLVFIYILEYQKKKKKKQQQQ